MNCYAQKTEIEKARKMQAKWGYQTAPAIPKGQQNELHSGTEMINLFKSLIIQIVRNSKYYQAKKLQLYTTFYYFIELFT